MRKIFVVLPVMAVAVIAITLLVLGPGAEHAANASPAVSDKAMSPYILSGNRKQQNVTVFLTWYGFNDNSDQLESQHNAATIAHPRNAGNHTLHNLATEGRGTFQDPITFAARDNDLRTFPIGSVIYVPLTQKYYIMEDSCGDNDPQGCLHGTHHVDLWMGPQHTSNDTALGDCEDNSTPANSVQVIINPSPSLPVDSTPEFRNNRCTVHLH